MSKETKPTKRKAAPCKPAAKPKPKPRELARKEGRPQWLLVECSRCKRVIRAELPSVVHHDESHLRLYEWLVGAVCDVCAKAEQRQCETRCLVFLDALEATVHAADKAKCGDVIRARLRDVMASLLPMKINVPKRLHALHHEPYARRDELLLGVMRWSELRIDPEGPAAEPEAEAATA